MLRMFEIKTSGFRIGQKLQPAAEHGCIIGDPAVLDGNKGVNVLGVCGGILMSPTFEAQRLHDIGYLLGLQEKVL